MDSASFRPTYLPASASATTKLTGAESGKSGSRLTKAANEFESVLLGQWLGSAEASFATVPGSDEDADAGGEQMKSFAVGQLAQALTAAGGIGIAGLVQKAFARNSYEESMRASVTKDR